MNANLNALHPKVKLLALKHIQKCKEVGITLNIYSTYRSITEQNALYAQGRTKAGKRVTNARGGYSYHNFRVAYDCVPMVNGVAVWGRRDLYKKIGQIGVSLGMEWGANFKIKDCPHFQFRNGLSLADFQNGKTLKW